MTGSATLVAIALIAGCGAGSTPGDAAADDQAKTISKSDFKDWPLTVPSGVLRCEGSDGVGMVTFSVGEKTYAVNGNAKEHPANLDIELIWAEVKTPGMKKQIGPLIEEGLRLCS